MCLPLKQALVNVIVTWFDAYIFEKYLSKASFVFPTVRKIRSYFTLKGISTQ